MPEIIVYPGADAMLEWRIDTVGVSRLVGRARSASISTLHRSILYYITRETGYYKACWKSDTSLLLIVAGLDPFRELGVKCRCFGPLV